MPLVRIDLRTGKDLTYRQEIGRAVYEAMLAVAAGASQRSLPGRE